MIWLNHKLLISKRKKNGLLGGLWELPGGKIKKEQSMSADMADILSNLYFGHCIEWYYGLNSSLSSSIMSSNKTSSSFDFMWNIFTIK